MSVLLDFFLDKATILGGLITVIFHEVFLIPSTEYLHVPGAVSNTSPKSILPISVIGMIT